MKSLLLRAAALALCLALSQPASSQPSQPNSVAAQPAQLTSEQWREDLAFMVAEMNRRHPNLYHNVSRSEFEAEVADINARIPTMQRNEIIVALMRLAAMVHDGHTRVDPRKDPKFGFPSLPLKLYLFEDGLFIRAAAPAHAALVGAEILEFSGVPVAEAIRRTRAIISVDNEMGYKLFAPLYLDMPDILHALKLSPSRSAAVLKLRKSGRTWIETVPAGEVDPMWPPDTDISLVTPPEWKDAQSTAQPLWLQAPLDYHRLVPLPDRKALYAQVNMITGINGQSLEQFGRKIRLQAEASNPSAVIVDLRLSYGGNHDLRHGFIRELVKTEDDDTRLYVLSWRGTFSASEAVLVDLARLTNAVFIGEAASSKPNSFGDAFKAALPNSGISIRTSIQWNQLSGQGRDPWTWVDVATPYRFADYAAGRDPALEAALAYQPEPTLSEQLRSAASEAEARRVVETYLRNSRHRYSNLEGQMLAAADALAAGKNSDVGLLVAELAAKRFPESHNAQLVFGILSERAGNLDAAAQAGNRAVAIEPNSRQGRSLVERVTGKLNGQAR